MTEVIIDTCDTCMHENDRLPIYLYATYEMMCVLD